MFTLKPSAGVFILWIIQKTKRKKMKKSIQDYLYSVFHDTLVTKLYRKLSFYNRFIYCRNLLYLTYGNIWLILYIVWGVVIISSQVFGHLRSFKGWIQTEACVIPIYQKQKQRNNRDIISVAVVPSNQKLFVQPKLKHNNNNVRLIRYNCGTRLCIIKSRSNTQTCQID